MRKYELDINETNIISTLVSDPIGRNREVFDFLTLLDNIDESAKISIDADWGNGKTFFVKQICVLLRYLRDITFKEKRDSDNDKKLEQLIINNKKSMKKTYIPVYYDAWLYDDHDDPIMSLIYHIVVNGYVDKDMTKKKNLVKKVIEIGKIPIKRIGLDIDIERFFETDDWVNSINFAENKKLLLQDILNEIIVEKCDKLVIVIDELDRCKPNYAVELLERIKHFFDDDRVIFVFSTNKEQLTHTIKKFYGYEFNASVYLNRFFDFQFSLENISTDNYLDFIDSSRNSMEWSQKILLEIGKHYKFSMREYNVYYLKFNKVNPSKYYERGLSICFNVFAPIAWALGITDIQKERKFLRGELESELVEIISKNSIIKIFIAKIIDKDEKVTETLCDLYEYVFKDTDNGSFISVSFDISNSEKRYFLDEIKKV